MSLSQRMHIASLSLDPFRSDYKVAYEIPGDSGPMRVLSADEHFMAAAMKGDLLPVIESYDNAKYCLRVEFPDEEPVSAIIHGSKLKDARLYVEQRGGKILSEIVAEHDWHEGPRVKAMNEFDAIEYCMRVSLPGCVLNGGGNAERFKIVHTADLPRDRTQRNDWTLNDRGFGVS